VHWQARKFGAEGIGLTRTEHMFFASEERIATVRRMIVAQVHGFGGFESTGMDGRVTMLASAVGHAQFFELSFAPNLDYECDHCCVMLGFAQRSYMADYSPVGRDTTQPRQYAPGQGKAPQLTTRISHTSSPTQSKEARLRALSDLLPFQRADFAGIFKCATVCDHDVAPPHTHRSHVTCL
jgi:phosphoenolpyruvate synthase/pyruvate phosphate dikinase